FIHQAEHVHRSLLMPKPKKKKASEMTTEELARRVFPKKVVEEIRRIANEPKKRQSKGGNSSHR
ncbi:MAG TPA: hypothetical protein VJB15_06300, partial [Rhodothermia bacterium]|nr:hypothetical protein [Rhodothermia bacterium]